MGASATWRTNGLFGQRAFPRKKDTGKTGHWGLKNMRERAARIGGTCKITTALGRGTHIEIGVPPSSMKAAATLNRV